MKAFDDFKNKQKANEVMVFDMLKYTYSDSLFNTLYINIKYKCYKHLLVAK